MQFIVQMAAIYMEWSHLDWMYLSKMYVKISKYSEGTEVSDRQFIRKRSLFVSGCIDVLSNILKKFAGHLIKSV